MGTTQMSAETAGAVAYGLGAKLGALLGAGALGALLIAAVDPAEAMPDPKKRRRLIFVQVIAAIVVCGFFGPGLVSWLVKPTGWVPVPAGDILALIEVVMPVGLLLGALSWGLIGVIVKLRHLIATRGADVVAKHVGLSNQEGQQP
jgi:hypothetical protein